VLQPIGLVEFICAVRSDTRKGVQLSDSESEKAKNDFCNILFEEAG
jgi:hypothetical protein